MDKVQNKPESSVSDEEYIINDESLYVIFSRLVLLYSLKSTYSPEHPV
jgi:hypothetical protein